MGEKRKQPISMAESSEDDEEVEEEVEEEEEEKEVEEEEEEGEEEEEEGEEEAEEVEEEDGEEAVKNPTGEESIDPSDRDAIQKLLEPFEKDELLGLLTEACLTKPGILSRLAASAASDTTHRRLFVHGLGPDATSSAVSAAFSPFGAFEECHAVVDRATGRCRGYAFVTFRRRSAARRALADTSKRVAGRTVVCQLASLGPTSACATPTPDSTGRKLFVNNVPAQASHEQLRRFFAKFGEIEEGPFGADHATGQFRGYAIFLYKSPEGLKKALEEPRKVFDGCELHCQRAHEGIKQKHNAAAGVQIHGAGVPALPNVQQNDIASSTYAAPSLLGLNPVVGLMAQGISPAVNLLGHNIAAGLLAPGLMGVSPVTAVVSPLLDGSLLSTPVMPYGATLGLGGSPALASRSTIRVSSVSPSIIGAYGSQTALAGLGTFDRSRMLFTGTLMSRAGHRST